AAIFAAWALMPPPPRSAAPTDTMKTDRHEPMLRRVIRYSRLLRWLPAERMLPARSLLPRARGPSRMAGSERSNAARLLRIGQGANFSPDPAKFQLRFSDTA